MTYDDLIDFNNLIYSVFILQVTIKYFKLLVLHR